jgi:hypothetical protein
MWRRRTVRALVLLAWCLEPSLAAASSATADPHDRCAAHACQCQRKGHCPPRRSAAKSCHEAAPSAEMTSRCNHESDPLPVASRSDTILSPAHQLGVVLECESVHTGDSGHPNAGHTRLDPQPPKAAF